MSGCECRVCGYYHPGEGCVIDDALVSKLVRERDEARAENDRLVGEIVKHQAAIEAQQKRCGVLRQEIERLREQFETARFVSKANQDRLAKCCTQRGARMQIMREWLDNNRGLGPPTEWWYFCEEHPNAKNWFDEDGVPK